MKLYFFNRPAPSLIQDVENIEGSGQYTGSFGPPSGKFDPTLEIEYSTSLHLNFYAAFPIKEKSGTQKRKSKKKLIIFKHMFFTTGEIPLSAECEVNGHMVTSDTCLCEKNLNCKHYRCVVNTLYT